MIIKTQDEIKLMKRAAAIGSSAFEAAFEYISANISLGITERNIAEIMEDSCTKHRGYEGLSFPPIIASGPNSAMPHAELTDRIIEQGDLLTIDFGVMAEGFASDMTRTIVIGEPTARQRKIYDTVLAAQLAGIGNARPGVVCRDLDRIVRDIIDSAGFGEYFVHTTGHGVGEIVHEEPRIGKEDETVLAQNMVVTIEPGIYIESFGGVRIEDTVVITEQGAEIITTGGIPKELTII